MGRDIESGMGRVVLWRSRGFGFEVMGYEFQIFCKVFSGYLALCVMTCLKADTVIRFIYILIICPLKLRD